MDRIDPLYYAHSSRINVKEETRIKATTEEAQQWEEEHKKPDGLSPNRNDFHVWQFTYHNFSDVPPNFISNIFYTAIAMSHYGYLQTIQNYNNLAKHNDDLQRHLDMLNGDGSWMGVLVIFYDSSLLGLTNLLT